ncbi:MAG: hypothetical protein HC854_14385 [Flavobacterium sp.]|nr:hypothetical protein [Flavobacterium sp.]
MNFKKEDVLKETEKAISVKIDGNNLWFQKKKVLFSPDGNSFEITQTNIDDAIKSFQEYRANNDKNIILCTNETIEDYNDNVYKFFINIEVNDSEKREFTKFSFISKKFISPTDIEDNEIKIPIWLWNKIEEEILKDCLEYSKKEYDSNLSLRDYSIINEVKSE